MLFDTTASLNATAKKLTGAKLPTGTDLVVTSLTVQFGEVRTDNRHLVRIYHHGAVKVHNDLLAAGLGTFLDMRATRNITSPTISLPALVKHEVSPNVRCKTYFYETMAEMLEQFSIQSQYLVGADSTGCAYVGRTDVLFLHQTAAQFVTEAEVQKILELAEPFENRRCLIFFLAESHTAMGADTKAMVDRLSEAATVDDSRPAYSKLQYLPLSPHMVSLLGVVQALSVFQPTVFQSCSRPKENFKIQIFPKDDAAAIVHVNSKTCVGNPATPKRIASLQMFTPQTFLIFGSLPVQEASIRFSDSASIMTVHTLSTVIDAPVETTLAEFIESEANADAERWLLAYIQHAYCQSFPFGSNKAHLVQSYRLLQMNLLQTTLEADSAVLEACIQMLSSRLFSDATILIWARDMHNLLASASFKCRKQASVAMKSIAANYYPRGMPGDSFVQATSPYAPFFPPGHGVQDIQSIFSSETDAASALMPSDLAKRTVSSVPFYEGL